MNVRSDVPTNDLRERQRIEATFHDTIARAEQQTFYDFGALDAADAYLMSTLGDLRGKSVLEIGCGRGNNTLSFASAGAYVTAIDISLEMIVLTTERATALGIADRVRAIHTGVEDMELKDSSIDIVYGHSVLHHLELRAAMPRIARVLRDGGIAAFLDPLDHNPVLNLLRSLTPNMRTPTEKPLSTNQIDDISHAFTSLKRREFYFLSLAAFFWYYVIRNESFFRSSLSFLSRLDDALFNVLPYFRRFSWVTVITLTK